MDNYYLTCRSLTYAQRVSRTLGSAGIKNTVVRTPQTMSREGCGYAVRLGGARLSEALDILSAAKLPPNRVFRILRGGGFEEARQ